MRERDIQLQQENDEEGEGGLCYARKMHVNAHTFTVQLKIREAMQTM